MIRHVVVWRLKQEAKRNGKIDSIDPIQRNLAALRAHVPGLLRLELGVNEVAEPDAADLLLYAEFASWQALHDYELHPLHEELRALIGPIRSERRVVNNEVES